MEEFTEDNYKFLLNIAANKFNFILFSDCENAKGKNILWRHDVDFSPHRALALAKIESQKNLSATYFFQLGSLAYNIFENDIREIIKKIHHLGHQIGLHFDPAPYPNNTKQELESALTFERDILAKIIGIAPRVFSFHNPTQDILTRDEPYYAGMINTYSKVLKEKFVYCSDSNGYWRHRALEEFLRDDSILMAQVLTHPEWWQKKAMLPRDRIQRCFKGKKENALKIYDATLKQAGRVNVKK